MKRLVVLAICLSSFYLVNACDICGCSPGNYFIGPFPQFHRHFIGMRYTFRSYTSQVTGDPSQFSHDFYQTTELWSGWNLGKKWQVLGFLPYNINRQNSDDGTLKSSGIGDLTLLFNYKLVDLQSKDHGRVSQQLWIGGGLKLPTGKFKADPNEIIPQANNQAGSGSVDYIMDAVYDLHIGNWGINTALNYKINSEANNFRFGNRFSSSAFVYHTFSHIKTNFSPNAGLQFEQLAPNKFSDKEVASTGGHALMAAGGLEINFKKIGVGANIQLPLSQDLSDGQTKAKTRGMIHLTWTL